MRTFEEAKSKVMSSLMRNMERYKKELEDQRLNEGVKAAAKKNLLFTQHEIENIDELTLIEIGAAVNYLIEKIKMYYRNNGNNGTMYFQQFDSFMEEFCLKNVPGRDLVCIQADLLGLSKEDLQCLKDTVPINANFGDELRQKVNFAMGTKIPTSEEMLMLQTEFNNTQRLDINVSEEIKDQALVDYMEMRRNAGMDKRLMPVDSPFLADNPKYQAAKDRLSGRSL